jgi:hypothetical protein
MIIAKLLYNITRDKSREEKKLVQKPLLRVFINTKNCWFVARRNPEHDLNYRCESCDRN